MVHSQIVAGRLGRPDGAEIAYEVAGVGPALLFAHGLGGNQISWWQQWPVFARSHRVIAFSHRGFAPSTTPGGAPDPHDYAGDAAALLDHLGVAQAVMICQSMGGWTGVELALARPERVAGLVLANTTGSFDFDGFGDAEVAAWRKRAPAEIARLASEGLSPATGRRMAQSRPDLQALYGALDRMNAGLDKDEIGRRIRAMRVRSPADAARIACPVLCITGDEDLLVSPRGVALVAAAMRDARVAVAPASGHSVYFERAELFNALVARFLREIGWIGADA